VPSQATAVTLASSPADWRGAALQDRAELRFHRLAAPEIEALEHGVARVLAAGADFHRATAADCSLDALAPPLASWLEQLDRGLGFVLVRGPPVDRWTRAEAAAAY
jgi:hypothetical protein